MSHSSVKLLITQRKILSERYLNSGPPTKKQKGEKKNTLYSISENDL